MGKLVFAIYKPNEGEEKALLEIISRHTNVLLSQDLISRRKVIVLKANKGQIIEIFEWKSDNAIGLAHENEKVLEIWSEFAKVCSYETLHDLSELDMIFPDFEVIA